MIRLLKIEWNKLFYYKATRIFIIVYFILMGLVGYFMSQFKPTINGTEIDFAKLGAFRFPYIWQNVTYFTAIGKLFLAIIIITNITNEYSNRTLKQNLIDGLSKREFLLSKIMTGINFALFSTLIVCLLCLVLGNLYTESTEISLWEGIGFAGAYLMKLVFFFTFCTFLAFLFRKTAFSLMSLFVWWVIEKLIGTIEFIIRSNTMDVDSIDSKSFYDYLPLESSSNLIPLPQIDIMEYLRGGTLFIQGTVDWTFFISSFLYTLIFIYLSYFLLKKRDL